MPDNGHHQHGHHDHGAGGDARGLRIALVLIVAFMVVEIVAGLLASSLALLSDAAHMLTDAAALAISLVAARLAQRPAAGAMTYGLGRAEILSAQANGMTMIVLAVLIVYGAIAHLISPPAVDGGVVLAVALTGIAVNLLAVRVLSGGENARSLNVEGSYRHILTDLYAFIATAIAALVILTTGFGPCGRDRLAADRGADAARRLRSAESLDPRRHGSRSSRHRPRTDRRTLAAQRGVVEVHDLHVWEVTSGFPALSAHIVVDADRDCHELRRTLSRLLAGSL